MRTRSLPDRSPPSLPPRSPPRPRALVRGLRTRIVEHGRRPRSDRRRANSNPPPRGTAETAENRPLRAARARARAAALQLGGRERGREGGMRGTEGPREGSSWRMSWLSPLRRLSRRRTARAWCCGARVAHGGGEWAVRVAATRGGGARGGKWFAVQVRREECAGGRRCTTPEPRRRHTDARRSSPLPEDQKTGRPREVGTRPTTWCPRARRVVAVSAAMAGRRCALHRGFGCAAFAVARSAPRACPSSASCHAIIDGVGGSWASAAHARTVVRYVGGALRAVRERAPYSSRNVRHIVRRTGGAPGRQATARTASYDLFKGHGRSIASSGRLFAAPLSMGVPVQVRGFPAACGRSYIATPPRLSRGEERRRLEDTGRCA